MTKIIKNTPQVSEKPTYYAYDNTPLSTTLVSGVIYTAVLSETNLKGGDYMLEIDYAWSHNANGNDFVCAVQNNGTQLSDIHKQEPKDSAGNASGTGSGTDQRYYCSRKIPMTISEGDDVNIELLFSTSVDAIISTMYEASIKLQMK